MLCVNIASVASAGARYFLHVLIKKIKFELSVFLAVQMQPANHLGCQLPIFVAEKNR